MSAKRSQPGKGNSHYDVMHEMATKGPYLTDGVGKCIRQVRTLNGQPRADINLCLRDSATYAASQAKEDLGARFVELRAVKRWLRWLENIKKNEWSPASEVLVDPISGVIRTKRGEYACLEDVESCLYERADETGDFVRSRVTKSVPALKDVWQDIEECGASLDDVPETERSALIDARRGQGRFRRQLWTDLWGRCAVTGCKNEALLRAAHIKPWRISDNKERLDKYNGFLLIPNLDLLFDLGFISFADSGAILISSRLSDDEARILGVHAQMKLCFVYPENQPYLAVHRKLHHFERADA